MRSFGHTMLSFRSCRCALSSMQRIFGFTPQNLQRTAFPRFEVCCLKCSQQAARCCKKQIPPHFWTNASLADGYTPACGTTTTMNSTIKHEDTRNSQHKQCADMHRHNSTPINPPIVSWIKASTSGERVPARGGHTCVVADFQLVVFGGTYYRGDGEFVYLGDTWVLDIESMTWQEVRCGGDLPNPRYGHSCHLVGSRMFVVGGKGQNGQLYRDVHFLDLVDWTWVAVNATSTGPCPRFWQASVLVGHKIVVHGGWNGTNQCFEDLWVFDTDSFAWMQPRTGGLPPTARYGHSMMLVPDGRILLSGGATVDDKCVPTYHKDLRQLDTETMLWSKARAAGGVKVSARCNHTLTSDEEGQAALLFGGWGLGGLQRHESNKRAGAVTLATYSMAPQEAVASCLPLLRGKGKPKHVYGHTCVAVGSAFFVFGGWNGQQAVNDVAVFELSDTT